ncbi:MAG: vWA domain-containing protein [Eubacteriales bacterium]
MLSAILKQIVVVTDGHSNKGGCPITAAQKANHEGITVSTIGLLDTGRLGIEGSKEIRQIAAAGGGIYHLTPMEDLAYTIHTVAVQVTRHAVRQIINQKLRAGAGTDLCCLPPSSRNVILPVLARMEEESELHIVLVLDTSGSMLKKRHLLDQSLRDLIISLGNRLRPVKLAVIQFPGPSGSASILKPLQSDNLLTSQLLTKLVYGGLTPTGPAIDLAVAALAESAVGAAAGHLRGTVKNPGAVEKLI